MFIDLANVFKTMDQDVDLKIKGLEESNLTGLRASIKLKIIKYDVPQGSNLDSLLFLVYIVHAQK